MESVLMSVLEFLNSMSGAAATIAVVLEFVFRMIPTKKPLSICHVISKVMRMVGDILLTVATLLDKILPQKVEETK